jgi:hypothetical protein
MFNNLPPNIQDWITQLKNPKIPVSIRYNYFNMLSNVVNEAKPELEAFKKVLDKAPAK